MTDALHSPMPQLYSQLREEHLIWVSRRGTWPWFAPATMALGLLGVGGLAAGIKSMAFAGGYIFGIIPIAALIWLHFQGQTREDARRMNCAVRLKQIGLSCRIYRIDYNGQFPPDFRTMVETKYLDVYKVYLCPSTRHTEGSSPRDLDGVDHCDYLYFGAGGKDAYCDADKKAAGQVLACDRPGNHHGLFNVVFVDGHVACFSGNSIESIMKENDFRFPVKEP